MQTKITPWLAALLLLGCVEDKPLEPGQSCPCAPGWSCDQPRNVCVAADAGAVELDAPSADDAAGEPMEAAPPAYPPCGDVSYPATGFYGQNALRPETTVFVSDDPDPRKYEIAAHLVQGSIV